MESDPGAGPVVVDSGAWVAFLRSPDSAQGKETARLIRDDRARVVGVVVCELLQGARSDLALRQLEELLRALAFLETGWDSWRRAGRLGRDLRRRGRTVPLSDLVVAATALDHGAAVFSTDEHFDWIPGLRRHAPEERPRGARGR